MITINFKKTHDDAIIPSKDLVENAGLDLCIIEDADIMPLNKALLKTGISMSMPQGYVGQIWARSKLASKKGVQVLAGIVDSNYRGEIMVSLLNSGDEVLELKKGDKVAQLVVQRHYSDAIINVVDELDETDRGKTGVNCNEMRYK